MKKAQIEIGNTYIVKVSGRLVSVRITANHSKGGFVGVNLSSGRQLHIKTAARLRPI